jgi:phosphoribosyl-dephospho-CoA transferase
MNIRVDLALRWKRLRPGAAAARNWQPHDLLLLDDGICFPGAPAWVAEAMARAPVVVVRRAEVADGVAIGIRGSDRTQRYGAIVSAGAVLAALAPEHLLAAATGERARTRAPALGRPASGERTSSRLPALLMAAVAAGPAQASVPALALIDLLRPLFAEHRLVWGPTGSCGFELASGLPVATADSDLDLLIRCPQALPLLQARRLQQQLDQLAARYCRIDVQLETPAGAVALSEYAHGARMLLRGAGGARIVADPWTETALAETY